MIKVELCKYEELPKDEKDAPENCDGRQYAEYARIMHNGKLITLKSDTGESEDVSFSKDIRRFKAALLECYRLGHADGRQEICEAN